MPYRNKLAASARLLFVLMLPLACTAQAPRPQDYVKNNFDKQEVYISMLFFYRV
jgi:hypothetical protein